MSEQMRELFANLPGYLGGHMLLSVTALATALIISLPLGVVVSRRPRLSESALAIAGIIQTIPSLALLALMMVILGGMIGFWPAFMALVLYSILPILANTVIGIRGIDPALTEAAQGLGMSDRQMMWRVQLPLAAPIIIAGVRTATVMVVGTATLATLIGGQSLGNYIFAGISTLNPAATMFGCVAAALLAVTLDQLVRLLEVAARSRSKRLMYAALAGLLLVTIGGLYEPVTRWLGKDNQVVIASAAFTEQYTLAHAVSRKLETAGFRPRRREGMAYGVQHTALQRGDVDCLVTYTGDVWSLLMKRQDFEDPETTRREVVRYLEEEYGVVYLGRLGFENAYVLAMPEQQAAAWGVKSIADLAQKSRSLGRPLTIAGDIGVFQRKEWLALKEKYQFGELRPVTMDQALTYGAVSEGRVDAIIAYTSDGRIDSHNLKMLDDPSHVFPPYDALLVVSRDAAKRPGFVEALMPLVDSIDLKIMQKANRLVDVDGQMPKQAANWLLGAIAKGKQP